jgi:YD repeat-containing protein
VDVRVVDRNWIDNSAGQLTSTSNDGTPGATDVTLNTTYNLFNELAGLNAVIGSTTEFTNSYDYDPDGNMTDVSRSGSAVTSKEASFTYNGDGQFTGMTLAAGGDTAATASYGYDDANRLTSLTYAWRHHDQLLRRQALRRAQSRENVSSF